MDAVKMILFLKPSKNGTGWVRSIIKNPVVFYLIGLLSITECDLNQMIFLTTVPKTDLKMPFSTINLKM
jgi:hypothetical protein